MGKAVILAMTYQKKLGLPNFSSHSCSVNLTVVLLRMSFMENDW